MCSGAPPEGAPFFRRRPSTGEGHDHAVSRRSLFRDRRRWLQLRLTIVVRLGSCECLDRGRQRVEWWIGERRQPGIGWSRGELGQRIGERTYGRDRWIPGAVQNERRLSSVRLFHVQRFLRKRPMRHDRKRRKRWGEWKRWDRRSGGRWRKRCFKVARNRDDRVHRSRPRLVLRDGVPMHRRTKHRRARFKRALAFQRRPELHRLQLHDVPNVAVPRILLPTAVRRSRHRLSDDLERRLHDEVNLRSRHFLRQVGVRAARDVHGEDVRGTRDHHQRNVRQQRARQMRDGRVRVPVEHRGSGNDRPIVPPGGASTTKPHTDFTLRES